MKIYLSYVGQLPKDILKKYYFLDAGCGRGEFLEILRKHGLKRVRGIDLNKSLILDLETKGFDAINSDVIKYLYLYKDQLCGISAFHLIEHLTFPQLFDFLSVSYQRLTKNGILILETPNIENLIVSSTTFYYDPTHIQKIPKLFLKTILEFVGFSKIEFLELHPARSKLKGDIDNLLFGAQDLGVISYK